jgi:DNA-binding transcriptional ArsR family regulator
MPAHKRGTKKGPSRPKKREVYWITRKDQLRTLASAVRLDIGDRLAALGPMSVKDLAASMGKKTTPIYHHLEQMEHVGLVRKTRASGTRGRPAAVYEAPSKLTRLARAPVRAANRKPMAKIGRIAASQAAKDYALGFKSKHWQIEGPARNHWFFRCITQPSPARLAKINELLDELAVLIWTPDPSPGPLSMSVAWFLAPLNARTPTATAGKPHARKRRGQTG